MYSVTSTLFSCLIFLHILQLCELKQTAAASPGIFVFDGRGDVKPEHTILIPSSGAEQMSKFRQRRPKRDTVSHQHLKLAGHKDPVAFCGDRVIKDPLHSSRPGGRRKRQAVGSFVVETIIILDYPLFLFWRARNSGRISTINEMVDYYSNLMEAVNRRYDSVTSSGFSIDIVVNAFIIAENELNSPWTQTLNNSNRIDANLALDNLNAFLQTSNGVIGNIPYDHAFIITGFDLAVGGQTSVAGIAQFLTCGVRSGSITEELKSETTAVVIAHEIGHAHDGDRNSCNGDDKFIMAASIGLPPRSQASHPWMFSRCSIDYFRIFLASSSGSCTRELSGSPLNLSPFLAEPFGQKYPPDIQCEIYLGTRSKFCRHLYDGSTRTFDDMCRAMFCDDPSSEFCFSIPAHDGTSCGNGKWCQQGLCVTSPSAPRTPENCPAGDDPDIQCDRSSCSDPTFLNFLCCATCKSPVPVTVPIATTQRMTPARTTRVIPTAARTTPHPTTPGRTTQHKTTPVTTTQRMATPVRTTRRMTTPVRTTQRTTTPVRTTQRMTTPAKNTRREITVSMYPTEGRHIRSTASMYPTERVVQSTISLYPPMK